MSFALSDGGWAYVRFDELPIGAYFRQGDPSTGVRYQKASSTQGRRLSDSVLVGFGAGDPLHWIDTAAAS